MRPSAPFPIAFLAAAGLGLTACARHDSAANALDNAAAQSDPAAAAELHNRADAIRNDPAANNLSAPDSAAQNALGAAGDAAARNSAGTAQPSGQ